jgi:hypothetical protein
MPLPDDARNRRHHSLVQQAETKLTISGSDQAQLAPQPATVPAASSAVIARRVGRRG